MFEFFLGREGAAEVTGVLNGTLSLAVVGASMAAVLGPPASTTAPTTVEEALTTSALGPKRVQGDAGEVEQHSIRDLIALDRYERSKQGGRGFRMGKFRPGGAP